VCLEFEKEHMTERLHIQRFLDGIGAAGFAPLLTTYGIKAKRDRVYPNLVLFKYDQIASPMGEPIVQECRGIILDESDGWSIVSRGFDKFFNHGEGHAAPIDWPSASVQEKCDGSLCVLYAYNGLWRVATTGTPDGSGDVNGWGVTFAGYFWRVFGSSNTLPFPREEGRGEWQFFFELCGRMNRVVVQHAEEKLVLLGGRRNGVEISVEEAHAAIGRSHPPVRSFPLGSFDEIAATFAELSPLSTEGYVVVDRRFRRVKVKHPGYVALHHAKEGMGPKALLQIARAGEVSEVLVAFPEFRESMEAIAAKLATLVDETERAFNDHRGIVVQKDFALAISHLPGRAAMFQMRAGKVASARQFFAEMPIDGLMRMLGMKDETVAAVDVAA